LPIGMLRTVVHNNRLTRRAHSRMQYTVLSTSNGFVNLDGGHGLPAQ
jgi:hypothetical protein